LAKSKKSDLEKLNNQLQSLQKQLIFAPTPQSANKIQLQIIAVKKKIVIAEGNKKSKLNSINPRIMQGGSPGLGKRK
jgi:hypothetical protein